MGVLTDRGEVLCGEFFSEVLAENNWEIRTKYRRKTCFI
jgi:hypothetical protein